MTHLEPEDILRRALREAAGSVEPAADGLTQIRARLSPPRPLLVAWLVAAWETVSQFVMLRLEPALAEIGPRLSTALRAADTRLEPVTGWLVAAVVWLRRTIKPQSGSDERPSRYGWVRPVAALAVVVLIAVVGGLALSGLPSQIARDGLNVFSGQTHGSGGGGHSSGGVTGGGKHYQPTSGTSSTSGTAPTSPATSSSSPKSKAKSTPTPTPSSTSPSPTTSPTTSSPTPSPTTSSPTTPPPSAGPTPTPTPSDASQSSS
jgi:hypothetical protein